MDAKKRQALINSLKNMSNFYKYQPEKNREWFLKKLIRGLEDEGLDDSTVEQKAREVVQKAKAIVKANHNFSLAFGTGKAAGNNPFNTCSKKPKCMRRCRIHILYGAIAFDRQFAEPQHLDYLLFVAKRRFRSVCRMRFWVNPNWQGYFRYPHACETNQHWRVNDVAAGFWEELPPSPSWSWYRNYSPWKLNTNGINDPVTAIEALFTQFENDPCRGNLFDCETTASIVLMDSLREAKNEEQFMEKLASINSEYLLIHRFVNDIQKLKDEGYVGQVNFVSDTTDSGLMRKVRVPVGDLQVGDQCYIFNHPLYRVFRPVGTWRGEYALVYGTGDRDYRSENGFVFVGHGKQKLTLSVMYKEWLLELQADLTLARQLIKVHLAYMRGGSAITPIEDEHDVKIGDDPTARYRLLQYDTTVKGKDFTKVPKGRARKQSVPGFVIVQSTTDHVCFLAQVDNPHRDRLLEKNLKKKITEIVPTGSSTGSIKFPIKFKRLTAPPSGATSDEVYGLAHWGVAYQAGLTEKIWPLFVVENGKPRRNEIEHKELLDVESAFLLIATGSKDLDVRQPKVDFGAGHQGFLIANGGI